MEYFNRSLQIHFLIIIIINKAADIMPEPPTIAHYVLIFDSYF